MLFGAVKMPVPFRSHKYLDLLDPGPQVAMCVERHLQIKLVLVNKRKGVING